MSFCGTCHGGFSKGSQDQHAANAGPINPHELAELERYERDPRFYPALQQYRQINSQYRTPFLGGSSKDGNRVYQDGRYAQRVASGQVRYAGRPYDPTKYMFTHEAVEGVLIRHFGLSYPAAHKLATAAERLAVEHDGINWAQHTAAMRPEIHLAEKESGSGTPPDLLVDPYKGTRYDKKVEENEKNSSTSIAGSSINQSAGNIGVGNQPPTQGGGSGPMGGYNVQHTARVDRGDQQAGDGWLPGKPDKGQGVRKFLLIRHGKTALNASNQSDDKIRGWRDVPLDATGKQEAVELGKKLTDSGINFIAHSNMKRTKDTAEEIHKTTGAKIVSWPPARPWNVGVFTGESSGKVHPELQEMAMSRPEEQIPEGESFLQFKCRVFAGLGELLEKSDGDHLALVTHHRVERLIHAWIVAGQPTDMSIDYETMFKHGEAPANADIVALDPERVRRAAESACAELNKQGFQKYTHKAAGYHEGFGPPTPEHPEGSHCGVCRYFKGKDKCMIVVPPIGADDGCALFMPKGTKTGDGGALSVGSVDENQTSNVGFSSVQNGGYSEGDMKVRNGKFGSTNWDEREGPGGGSITGAPPRADGASHMHSGIAGGYGQLTQPIPFGSAPSEQGEMQQRPWTEKDEERRQNLPTKSQSGGYGAQSFKPNYSVGAGGPPKAPKMAQAIQQHSHYLAKGGLMHALKAGHIDKDTHAKAMASIDGALSKLKASKPKLGSAPKPKAPHAAPGGGSTGAGRRMGSMGSPPPLAGPLPDFMGSGGNGNGGFSPGPGPGSFMPQGNPMGGQVMPWQK